jgi:hypothetical protein
VRSTIQPLSQDDQQSSTLLKDIQHLNDEIETKIIDVKQPNLQEPMFDVYEPWEPEADKPEADDFTPETYDATVSAELFLPKENVLLPAKVIG